jgi:hypothetical protein
MVSQVAHAAAGGALHCLQRKLKLGSRQVAQQALCSSRQRKIPVSGRKQSERSRPGLDVDVKGLA